MTWKPNYYALALHPHMPDRPLGHIPIKFEQTEEWNEKGFDIFWTVNEFNYGCRKKSDLKKIHAFYVDMDSGTHDEMKTLLKSVLAPTFVIQTRNGYHAYWFLDKPIDCEQSPEAKCDWFREFIKQRMLPKLNGDTQAADACRLLRPAFLKYWKDGMGTFHSDIVFETDNRYTLEQMDFYFPVVRLSESPEKPKHTVNKKTPTSDNFWGKVQALDTHDALMKLSGTSHVHGETYVIKNNRVVINNRPANVWIDTNGRIGSTDGAAGSIANWLYWYQKDWKRVVDVLKEVWPELAKE